MMLFEGMRILLLTPPMTQINTPYPATAYLTGFLRERGFCVEQTDPAIELVLKLFSPLGILEMERELKALFQPTDKMTPKPVRYFLKNASRYHVTVETVIRFLQGKDPMAAHRIISERFLPRGPRFAEIPSFDDGGDGLAWAFGALGVQDRAQYFASLYIDDLADVVRLGLDPNFGLSRYAEKLASSAPSFTPILEALKATPTLVDRYLDQITEGLMQKHQPDVVGMTLPFPGNVYGAFRMAQTIRRIAPGTRIIMGGGYVNTELRDLKDPQVFDYVDYITLDDGERPLLTLLENLQDPKSTHRYLRTMLREEGAVVLKSDPKLHDIPFKECGTPTYQGLPNDRYLSMCELLNPMHRLWSDGRWNKLTLAHGCYWKKCSFCDVTLDYISRYEPQSADVIVDRIVALVAETGQSGFHFVDEAAPPNLLGALAKRLIERNVQISWWVNIRFEKTFTPELTRLMADSGCIAVSGGLEVASDRLLQLMEKGVSVEQVARVTHAFTEAGIMVHAYLMYGFPTQTTAETVDALERVRQLFAAGCLQSGFWHRFSATLHSPVGKHPERYGIQLEKSPSNFAANDLPFIDPTGTDHDALYPGLKKALYNYMHGVGLDKDVRDWFDFSVPKAKVSKNLVESALKFKGGSSQQLH